MTNSLVREKLPGLLEELTRRAWYFARNRGDAEDLLQDTIVRALAHEHSYVVQPGHPLMAWLCTIMRNQWFNVCRERKRCAERLPLLHLPSATQPSQETVIEFKEMLGKLNRLSDEMQDALVNVHLLEYEYQEAATMAGVPVGTIKSRASRGRTAFMGIMKHHG